MYGGRCAPLAAAADGCRPRRSGAPALGCRGAAGPAAAGQPGPLGCHRRARAAAGGGARPSGDVGAERERRPGGGCWRKRRRVSRLQRRRDADGAGTAVDVARLDGRRQPEHRRRLPRRLRPRGRREHSDETRGRDRPAGHGCRECAGSSARPRRVLEMGQGAVDHLRDGAARRDTGGGLRVCRPRRCELRAHRGGARRPLDRLSRRLGRGRSATRDEHRCSGRDAAALETRGIRPNGACARARGARCPRRRAARRVRPDRLRHQPGQAQGSASR